MSSAVKAAHVETPAHLRVTPTITKKKPAHYVNNQEFLAALKEFKAKTELAKLANAPLPRMSEFLGSCFLKIATHLSYKPNFVNYTFRDDMVSDGVENCLVYVHNFNPEKTNNPFGYFTTVIWYAFLRRIQREKKHTYIKYKLLEKALIDGLTADAPDGSPMQVDTTMLTFDNVQDFITRYDDYTGKRRERRRQGRSAKTAHVK
jgi:hypothetical protein